MINELFDSLFSGMYQEEEYAFESLKSIGYSVQYLLNAKQKHYNRISNRNYSLLESKIENWMIFIKSEKKRLCIVNYYSVVLNKIIDIDGDGEEFLELPF